MEPSPGLQGDAARKITLPPIAALLAGLSGADAFDAFPPRPRTALASPAPSAVRTAGQTRYEDDLEKHFAGMAEQPSAAGDDSNSESENVLPILDAEEVPLNEVITSFPANKIQHDTARTEAHSNFTEDVLEGSPPQAKSRRRRKPLSRAARSKVGAGRSLRGMQGKGSLSWTQSMSIVVQPEPHQHPGSDIQPAISLAWSQPFPSAERVTASLIDLETGLDCVGGLMPASFALPASHTALCLEGMALAGPSVLGLSRPTHKYRIRLECGSLDAMTTPIVVDGPVQGDAKRPKR